MLISINRNFEQLNLETKCESAVCRMKDMEYVDLQINNNDVCSCSMLKQTQMPTRTCIHTHSRHAQKRDEETHFRCENNEPRIFTQKKSFMYIHIHIRLIASIERINCEWLVVHRIIQHDLVISRNGITRHLGQWFVNNLTFQIRNSRKQNNIIRLHSVKLCLNGRTTVNSEHRTESDR